MYLFLWVVIFASAFSFVWSFGNSLVDFFETLAILSALLLPIKSPGASAVFWIALFVTLLKASAADCLALSRSFWMYLPLQFLLINIQLYKCSTLG